MASEQANPTPRPPMICPRCVATPVRSPEDRDGTTWYCEHSGVWVVLVGKGADRRWIVRQGVDRRTYALETAEARAVATLHAALGTKPPALRLELGGESEGTA